MNLGPFYWKILCKKLWGIVKGTEFKPTLDPNEIVKLEIKRKLCYS